MPSPEPGPCGAGHYSLAAACAEPTGHDGAWHHTTHPDTGQRLRFQGGPGPRHTQEWLTDDDPDAPDAGMWVTWHYAAASEPTPLVPADLDERAAAHLSHHFPTGQVRNGPSGVESECACGTWYRRENRHLGREVSIMMRMYFDNGLEAAATRS